MYVCMYVFHLQYLRFCACVMCSIENHFLTAKAPRDTRFARFAQSTTRKALNGIREKYIASQNHKHMGGHVQKIDCTTMGCPPLCIIVQAAY